MFVIEYDVYVCEIQGDITVWVVVFVIHSLVYTRVCFTCDLVQALSGHMIVLVDPFSVTFKVDLCGRWSSTPQLDWTVLYDESVLRFKQEFWEGLCRRWWEGVGENLGVAVVAALWGHRMQMRLGRLSFNLTGVKVTAGDKLVQHSESGCAVAGVNFDPTCSSVLNRAKDPLTLRQLWDKTIHDTEVQ